MKQHSRWGMGTQTFHWLTAVFIFVTASLGWIADSVDSSPGQIQLYLWHKSVGISVLGLIVLRLIWRLCSQTPRELDNISSTNQFLAKWGHWLLYLVAALMPLTGWLLTSAANFPFQWFGFFEVPLIWEKNEEVKAFAKSAHYYLFWTL